MNVFDFLFESTSKLSKEFVLGHCLQISYKDIYVKSSNIARRLRSEVGENNPIIILSENSTFFITAYLAILKSGNICIPLNPSIEKLNLQNILRRTDSRIAFVSKRYQRIYEGSQIRIIGEDYPEILLGENLPVCSDQADVFDSERLAEIIFTSGSTGEQKGVLITHKNIVANTNSIIEYLNLTQADRIEVVLPFYYCYGLSLLHTHMKVGGSLVINNSFMFIGSVLNDINEYKCTGFAGVPSHFQILLRKTRDFKSMQFPTLRYVTQAGGKLHATFIKEFVEAFPTIKFFVMYGQTEATARLSYLPPELLSQKSGSIGKGIPGVTLQVVNENGELVKPNETGEIIAKGENIMLGYLDDPVATLKTLHGGWLYTGDLAKVDEDGYIFIQSRKKEIIKVGGIRISPKEIEEVIVSYPGVIDCSIELVPDELLGEAMKATIIINEVDQELFCESVIKRYCANHLAYHKIPKIIIFDTKLPFNSIGKK
jgi:long-chain acyl-CoA synthetase